MKMGDEIKVKVILIDDQGRIKLSRKAAMKELGESDPEPVGAPREEARKAKSSRKAASITTAKAAKAARDIVARAAVADGWRPRPAPRRRRSWRTRRRARRRPRAKARLSWYESGSSSRRGRCCRPASSCAHRACGDHPAGIGQGQLKPTACKVRY